MALADTARLIASLELQDKFSRPAAAAEKQVGSLERSISRLGSTSRTALGTGLGFIGAQVVMRGVSTAFSAIKDAAIGMNASLETSTLQFETLMGSSEKAEAHVRSLFEFAARTPFETAPIIEASRIMETFGGSVLNSRENLTLFGDAAAATSAPIEEVAFWSSRLFAALKAGRPFGEAAQRLSELGILVPEVRTEMEDMQETGADGLSIWARYQRELGRFGGAMEKQAGTWAGLTSSIKDNIAILGATTFEPIFDTAKAGMEDLLAFLSTPEATAAAERFAGKLAEIINPQNLREAVGELTDFVKTYGPQFGQVIGNIPWDQIKTSFTIMGTGSKALLDTFLGMPEWVQTAVLTGWGLNKLTGGALGDIGGGVLSVVFQRGASPANPMWVQQVGGIGGGGGGVPGVPGTGGPMGPIGPVIGAALGGALAGLAVGGGLQQEIIAPAREFEETAFAERTRTLEATEANLDTIRGTLANMETDQGIGLTHLAALVTGQPSIVDTLRAQEDQLVKEQTALRLMQHTMRENTSSATRESNREVLVSNRIRDGIIQAENKRERDAASALKTAQAAHVTLENKNFSPSVGVVVNSSVSITDINRRTTSQRISMGIRGGVTVE